jgi:N-acetylmuramic acid 6-phosphate etherase
VKTGRRKTAATEERNPRSRGLDLKSTAQILRILNHEDAQVARAVALAIPRIARAVDRIVDALADGGRLIYIGAGTSGRLGVLDAAECPPTFGVPPRRVLGLIAGGRRALTTAVEGAEDSAAAGARDLAVTKLSARDVVVGLTASGQTPYVFGALEFAKRHRAATVCVTGNAASPLAKLADVAIVVETGPEALAGSTRLKAGTAQKMVLNMLSTAAMVRLGYVYDNWMINVAQTNRKLMLRAAGILEAAANVTPAQARRALEAAGSELRVALVLLKTNSSAQEARKRLKSAQGNLRAALGEQASLGRKSRRSSAARG